VCPARTRAHPCARPRAEHAADPSPARRGREGPGKSEERGSPCRRSKMQKHGAANQDCVVPAKAGTQRLCLCSRSPLKPRRRADGKAACPARGRREGSRRFFLQATDGLWKNPFAPSAPSPLGEGATPRACSLWLLSLARARENNSAARKADETYRDVSRSSQQRTENPKSKVKLDSDFRRNDARRPQKP
jgi:hypothetical protein